MKKVIAFLVVAVLFVFTDADRIYAASPLVSGPDFRWLKFCSEAPASPFVMGSESGALLEVAQQFTIDNLQAQGAVGKTVTAMAVYVATPVGQSTIFIKEGTGTYTKSETRVEQSVSALVAGWNYILLDQPYTVTGTTPIFLSYSLTDNGLQPVAFDGENRRSEISQIGYYTDGYKPVYEARWGNPMIAALIDGDTDRLGSVLTIGSVENELYTPIGDEAKAVVAVANGSFNPVNSFTVRVASESGTNTADYEAEVAPRASAEVEILLGTVFEQTTAQVSITRVNGVEIESPEAVEVVTRVYDPAYQALRKPLLDKFTGQLCSWCPDGERAVKLAIAGRDDLYVRVDHHTYSADNFTMDVDFELASYFGVTSAPMLMLDRTGQELRPGGPVAWNPTSIITPEMLRQERLKLSNTLIEITPDYDEATRRLNATVNVRYLESNANPHITVLLTHSGIVDYQINAQNWSHDHFPIAYLTDHMGDAMEVGSDGLFSKTYTIDIKPQYGNSNPFDAVPEQIHVIAFVHAADGPDAYEVYNAEKACIVAESEPEPDDPNSGIEGVGDDVLTLGFKVVDGHVVNSDEVYSLSGTRMANRDLAPGAYIAVANTPQGRIAAKVVVK